VYLNAMPVRAASWGLRLAVVMRPAPSPLYTFTCRFEKEAASLSCTVGKKKNALFRKFWKLEKIKTLFEPFSGISFYFANTVLFPCMMAFSKILLVLRKFWKS
jgi:hypothetical protein